MLTEKATSKSQQKLMGMVHAYKQGTLDMSDMSDSLITKIKKIADGISDKDAKDFASTKHDEIKESEILWEEGSLHYDFKEYMLVEYLGKMEPESFLKHLGEIIPKDVLNKIKGKAYNVALNAKLTHLLLVNPKQPTKGHKLDFPKGITDDRLQGYKQAIQMLNRSKTNPIVF